MRCSWLSATCRPIIALAFASLVCHSAVIGSGISLITGSKRSSLISKSAILNFQFALVLKSKLGVVPKYLWDHIRSPLPAISHRLFRSLDWQVLFVLWVRTTIAQTRSFATMIGPSLYNALPSSLYLTLLFGSLSASLSILKTYFYSRGVHTGSATEWSLP